MKCRDCGRELKACRTATRMLIRAGLGDVRTDRDHRASRSLFADEPEPAELSVAGWHAGEGLT